MNEASKETLRQLYKELADHTAPECAGENEGCKLPHSCCSPEYCEMSQHIAQKLWDTDVSGQRTDHERLPFMGPSGCVLEPHLRPWCSRHACCINGLGAKIRGENADEWTDRYNQLVEQIDELEMQLL